MTTIAEAYVSIKVDKQPYQKSLKSMELATQKSVDRMTKNFDRIGKGVSEMSRAARLGFLAMSAAIAGTVYAAAKYEKQMATVSTMLTRKSMPIMEKYKDIVGKMGIIFGESTETLSKGLYDILSASIRPEKALKVLAVSAKAAAAGLTDTGVAADAITTIINSYGYAAEDASMISDKLFTIIARGKTTFAELGPNIGKVAATAAMAGLSFDDLGATIATVTRAGIRTEMAMTAINGVLKVFIKPTDEAKEAARGFGLELDTNTLQTIGFTGVLEKLNGATAEQLALIFPEIEGLKGLAAAVGDLTGYTDDYRAMLESAGATQEAYLKQTNTLTFTFNQLKEAGKYLAVQVGEIFTPIISQAIKKITDQAIKLGQAIKNLTSEQKDSVAQMVLFGTAVLGAIGSLSLFSVAARLVVAAGSVIAGTLGLIFSPLGLLIVGIGALVLAWTLGWKKIKEITSKLVEIVVMPTIKFVGEKIENLADFIQEKLGIPEEARKGIWELTDITANIDFFVKLLWGGIVNIVGTIKDWVIEKAKLDDPIGDLVASVAEFLIELPDPAKWFFKIGTRVWEYASLGMGIWWAAKGLLSAIKFAPIALPALLPIIVGIGLALVGIDVLGNKLKEKLDEAKIDELLTAFSVAYPSLFKLSVGIKEVTGLELPLLLAYIDKEWKGTAAKLSLIFLAAQIPLKILWDIDLRTVFTDFWEDTKEVLRDTWDRITWPVLSWDNFITTLSEAWDNVDWSWFGFDEVKEFFKDIWESFDWSWLNWENFVTALQEAWDNTDWGWWEDSIKWLFGLFKKEPIEIDTSKATESLGELDKAAGETKQILKKLIPPETVKDIKEIDTRWQIFTSNVLHSASMWGAYDQVMKGSIGAMAAELWLFNDEALKVAKETPEDFALKWNAEFMRKKSNIQRAILNAIAARDFEKALSLMGEDFADAILYGASPGGLIPGLDAGQKDVEASLSRMTDQMSKMVDGMSKIFMPIIDIFKVIFTKVIAVIKEFDEEAGTELEKFVNETLGLIDDMFRGMEKGTEEMSLTVRRLFRDIAVDVKGEIKGITEAAKTFAEKATDIWTGAFEAIGRAARDNIVDVINGAKTMGEAFIDFGQTLQTQVADAFWSLAVAAAKAGEWASAAWLGVASIIISTFNTIIKGVLDWIFGVEEASERVQTAWGEFAESWKIGARKMGEYLKDLANRFSEIGLAISNTIEASQRKLQGLYQSIEDLGKGTREKLIAELDKYYDYQILRDMDLTQLLELSAKTREEIEKGTLVSVAETAEETAAREKDAKVGALKEIEEAHKREMDLINQRILLTKIEIKLFELQMTAVFTGGRKRYAIQKELNDLLDEYDDKYTEVGETTEDVTEATEDATKAAKEYGRVGERSADDVRDAFGRTRGQIEDLEGSTNQARVGIERWGEDGRRNAQKITEGFKEARIGIELWSEEISKIPRRIDFDIVGDLIMPRIPKIGDQEFKIKGIYAEPYIPSYQVGIPYVPRTQVAVIHKGEAVVPAHENKAGAAGAAGGKGNIIIEKGAIRILNTGPWKSDVDLEKFADFLARKMENSMRRP